MKKSVLRAYARLIAESGVNVQKGQEVFITAGLDQPEPPAVRGRREAFFLLTAPPPFTSG